MLSSLSLDSRAASVRLPSRSPKIGELRPSTLLPDRFGKGQFDALWLTRTVDIEFENSNREYANVEAICERRMENILHIPSRIRAIFSGNGFSDLIWSSVE